MILVYFYDDEYPYHVGYPYLTQEDFNLDLITEKLRGLLIVRKGFYWCDVFNTETLESINYYYVKKNDRLVEQDRNIINGGV